ncbi:MAG: GNAT family N-acetyltransferase [Bacteroidales bacterium]|nr:GNAT family N-acetyltransferase [Bacteroidales bacterium]
MEAIIPAIDPALLSAELTPDKKLQDTNKGGNELYIVTAHDAPNVMLEIGRLREEAFRAAGGSSGKSADIDEYDTMDNPYRQLVVWDPSASAILGGYRFMLGNEVDFDSNGVPRLATAHMFRFSDKFISEYLPHTMELGRSFVSVGYQSSKAGAKAIFSMDNLWDGIAAVMMQHSRMLYFFGKMTIYQSYNPAARDLLFHFLFKHFPDRDNLVTPIEPVLPDSNAELMDLILNDEGFKSDYRNLKDAMRRLGTNIPPLVNSYINSSPTMKMFGTAVNHEFGEVFESAILVCFKEMYDEKVGRHIEAYTKGIMDKVLQRFPKIGDLDQQRLARRFQERKENVFVRFNNKKDNPR